MDDFAEPVIGRAFAGTRWLAMTRLAIPHHPRLPRVTHASAGPKDDKINESESKSLK
jgi:hypothetical protein